MLGIEWNIAENRLLHKNTKTIYFSHFLSLPIAKQRYCEGSRFNDVKSTLIFYKRMHVSDSGDDDDADDDSWRLLRRET